MSTIEAAANAPSGWLLNSSASQRCHYPDLQGAGLGLRESSPGTPKMQEPIHSLLAPTPRSGDQQAPRKTGINSGVNIYPSCLEGSRKVVPFLIVST